MRRQGVCAGGSVTKRRRGTSGSDAAFLGFSTLEIHSEAIHCTTSGPIVGTGWRLIWPSPSSPDSAPSGYISLSLHPIRVRFQGQLASHLAQSIQFLFFLLPWGLACWSPFPWNDWADLGPLSSCGGGSSTRPPNSDAPVLVYTRQLSNLSGPAPSQPSWTPQATPLSVESVCELEKWLSSSKKKNLSWYLTVSLHLPLNFTSSAAELNSQQKMALVHQGVNARVKKFVAVKISQRSNSLRAWGYNRAGGLRFVDENKITICEEITP
ncbi:hypothetical protein BV22DRAFT_1050772 [Leucogyrophana mollusca]|uniref:Uncharacterized protein n=1 Tax=Leucogyrophana mollusca TaxID=85980 RepID=A0ACB8B3V6_9AGAM|nr:hypothetical protein BV22DRAFT_1050772 [Leucogyrophana mollusca]